jgi:hypothetical protein
MRRKISQGQDHLDGPQSRDDPAIKEISETLARDAARREHRSAAQFISEDGAKPTRKRSGSHQPNALNVLPMLNAGEVWERKNPGKGAAREPTAIDVAGSMFVASAQLVVSVLEELKAHAAAVRTKRDVEDILTVQIARWRVAVTQFRVEQSRRWPKGKQSESPEK